ncbi:DUF4328 domain-containing protein [Streptomyces sp. CA-181903]|uniref:DUF4328 domain-containing protein n=1 Tax=Streptomyces sp. CA-181903 TaxID=3240055 RepID=UPI003D8B8183
MGATGCCSACAVPGAPPPGGPGYGGGPDAAPGPGPLRAGPPPPPYPGPRPGPLPRLASPVGLGRAVAALLVLVVLTDVFALFAETTMYGVADKAIDGGVGALSRHEADRADSLQFVSGIVQTVALLACAVLFLVWFHRVRSNAEVFRSDGHRLRRGWSIWGWMVPVVNLWFPKQIADDVWAASLPYRPDGSPVHAPRTVVNWWWGLWIATLLLGRGSGRMYDRAETFEEIRLATGVLMVADVVDIAAAVLALLFVRRLTALQDAKAHQGPVPPVAVTV